MFDYSSKAFAEYIQKIARTTLEEDLGQGDASAELIPVDQTLQAEIITREPMVLAGQAFVNAVFHTLSPEVAVKWHHEEAAWVPEKTTLCHISGNARALLSGERTALNLLQTLSGTATQTKALKSKIDDLDCVLLDTRKTLPGLRLAKKYAVYCGGGHNHRMGLYDAVLLKENHLACFDSIAQAVHTAQTRFPKLKIEVEVESLGQLQEALLAGAQHILLDNFTLPLLREAVKITAGKAALEASGNVTQDTIREIAQTGVNAISVGGITKHLHAIDLSMRFLG